MNEEKPKEEVGPGCVYAVKQGLLPAGEYRAVSYQKTTVLLEIPEGHHLVRHADAHGTLDSRYLRTGDQLLLLGNCVTTAGGEPAPTAADVMAQDPDFQVPDGISPLELFPVPAGHLCAEEDGGLLHVPAGESRTVTFFNEQRELSEYQVHNRGSLTFGDMMVRLEGPFAVIDGYVQYTS